MNSNYILYLTLYSRVNTSELGGGEGEVNAVSGSGRIFRGEW